MATNYHTLFFGAGFLIFFLLAVLFILPLTIFQLIKIFKPTVRLFSLFTLCRPLLTCFFYSD